MAYELKSYLVTDLLDKEGSTALWEPGIPQGSLEFFTMLEVLSQKSGVKNMELKPINYLEIVSKSIWI